MINSNKITSYSENFFNTLIDYAPKLVSAFLILFVGLYAIKIINKLVRKLMIKREFEPTLSKFLADILNWTLKVLLFVSFISKLGIETSSFVAILGAAGLAVGLSLQGSLSNFAGGVLIILFKPFKVNDVIEAQGAIGSVLEIQIFVTKLLMGNNHTVFIPNGTLSNGTIINYTAAGKRRSDFLFSIPYSSDIKKIRSIILNILSTNEFVLREPAATVEITSLTDSGIKLAIRSWATNENFHHLGSEILEQIIITLENENIEIQPYLKEIGVSN
jgi:small conductance mechanosensitive channel